MTLDKRNQNKKQNKSICFVLPYWPSPYATGGAELQSHFISEELLKRGWRVEVVTQKVYYDKSQQNPFYNSNIKYWYYKPTNFLIVDFFSIFFKLLKTKSAFYYNRTNARFLRSTCGLYCKLFNKKNIFALANDVDVLNIPLYKVPKKKSFTKVVKHINAWIMDKLIRKYAFTSDFFIAQTHVQKKLLKESCNKEAQVVRNSLVFPEKKGAEKENIILWVSNVRPQKRVELLKKLADEMELKDWKMVMIGNYNKHKNIVESIKNPNFKAMGKLPFKEALNWYEKSKILINTSSHEGLPNAFIQSWYFKTLVVSFEFDPDGLLKDKNYGYCAHGDFDKFKEILYQKMQSYNDQDILERAYNFSLKEFDIKENVSKFLSIIENK